MQHNVFDQANREIKSIDNVFGKFLVEAGLYDKIDITNENIYELADLIGGHVKIDLYCPKCKEKRVFLSEAIKIYRDEGNIIEYSLEEQIVLYQKALNLPLPLFSDAPQRTWSWNNDRIADGVRVMIFRFKCAMDESHRTDFIVLTEGNLMIKIGQYPSVADLSFPELKNYEKVISGEDLKELKRAIGLYANGIGIGSFVYLRRIFERILEKTSEKLIGEGKLSEELFKKSHVDEKIKLLSEYLPKSMTDNPLFYGIVSKGIHSLSENECIDYFPVLKSYIMMVYRQWEKLREDEEEEKSISSSINTITTRLK